MATTDKQIGENLARHRKGMSQKELADRMRELGWKWSQATVWSIEKGERPLRLAEAEALEGILGFDSITSLFASDAEAELEVAGEELFRARTELEKAMRKHFSRRLRLARIADSYSATISEAERAIVLEWLSESPAVIADGLKKQLYAEHEGALLMDVAIMGEDADGPGMLAEVLSRRKEFTLKLIEDWDPYVKPEEAS